MRKSKFTPGPWLVEKMGPNMFKIESQNEPICRLHDFNFQGAANAALISAAPEMAEALEVVDALLSAKPDYGPGGITGFEADALATVRQALFKARGGSK